MPSSRRQGRPLRGRGAVLGPVLLAGGLAAQTRDPLPAVDRFLAAEVARQRIPGLSVAVLRGDSVLLARGYGFASLEHRVPAADSTVYQSGSVGKQFTAALVQLLARDGRLGLDDPIRRHLPEGPAAWDRITIRHLLTHTSGLPDYTDSLVDYRRDYREEELVRLAAGLDPEFEPGERWSYSNTGYVLLGAIVRRVTGRFYGEVLRERVFQPAGMRTARIISESEIVPNRSDGYRLVDGRVAHQEWVAPSLNTTADGSLYLSVRDLAAWAVALDHRRVLGPAELAEAWTPVRLRGGGTYPYGFGWRLGEQRGHRLAGHGGSWQGFRSSIQRYPEYDLTVIVLANLEQAEPEAISFGVAGIVEPGLAAPHLVRPFGGERPPRPIGTLLGQVAGGETRALAPEYARFLSSELRHAISELDGPEAWTFVGCDDLRRLAVERLGASIARVCYARRAGASGSRLVAAAYTSDWMAAFIDWYDY